MEFHLRDCQDIDLDDLDAVRDLVRQFGSPIPFADGVHADLPGKVDLTRQAARAGRRWGSAPPTRPAGATWVHVDEVIYRIKVIRQLSAHAVAYRRGDYVAHAWPAEVQERNAKSLGITRRALGDKTAVDTADFRDAMEIEAWRDFISYTDRALQPFHFRVAVEIGHRDYDIGVPRPTLYQAAVMQIVNDLAEHVDYHRCPQCDRTFARQIGRAEHGQNRRTGVTYCTPTCATNARVKAYRARNRAEKGNG